LEPLEDYCDLIRQFIHQRPSYEQLASEAAYILDKRLREAGIKFSAVTHRAKTEESLRKKLKMKSYSNPLEEVTDLAGVRIVYQYSNDFKPIKEIISNEFEIIETVDKFSEQGVDKFGYVAVHYIVHLGQKSSGARYDNLKLLKCEIQVRTALQDAWAIINHHLIYKREQDVPTPLRRKFNALSGLLETADNQFDYIRLELEQYTEKVKLSLATEQGLDQEINVDSIVTFLKDYFPDAPEDDYEYFVPDILDSLDSIDREKYKTLGDLKKLLDRQAESIKTLKEINTIHGEARWGPASILYSCIFNL
jgi:putative GTP pyrophosphokinase